ncbi:MAG: hypothetical protein WA843_03730, partial [Candidatus Saccharimonadales bacterium]
GQATETSYGTQTYSATAMERQGDVSKTYAALKRHGMDDKDTIGRPNAQGYHASGPAYDHVFGSKTQDRAGVLINRLGIKQFERDLEHQKTDDEATKH